MGLPVSRWVVYAFTATFFWGTTPVVVKFLVEAVHPVGVALYRFVFAVLILAVLLGVAGKLPDLRLLTRRDLLKFLLLGTIGVPLFTILFFVGIQLTTASKATLLLNANPAVIAILATLLLHEKLSSRLMLGIVAGFLGVFSVMVGGRNPAEIIGTGSFLGDVLAFASGVSWASFSVLWRLWIKSRDSQLSMSLMVFLGTATMLPIAAPFNALAVDFSSRVFLLLLYLGVFTVVIPYFSWIRAIEIAGAARVGPFQFIAPLVTLLLSVSLLREVVDVWLALGFILITTSIYLTLRG